MEKRAEDKPPLDERAVLEELERFRSDIERYRQQRKTVGDEFDAFVKTLKSKSVEAAPAPPAPRPAAIPSMPVVPSLASPPTTAQSVRPAAVEARPQPPSGGGGIEPPVHAHEPAAPQAQAPSVVPPVVAPSEPARADRTAPLAARPASGSRTPLLVALLVIIAAGAAWILWPRGGDEGAAPVQGTTPVQQSPAVSPPAATTTPPVSGQETTPATPAPAADETVITTTEHVWMRVTADGKVVREAEFPAGSRLPVRVENTLVIRTGNAGAVTLTLRGKPLGALGSEGQVVTRTYTIER
jgi:hypothetical protein